MREFVPPYILLLNPDFVAARSLRSPRSHKRAKITYINEEKLKQFNQSRHRYQQHEILTYARRLVLLAGPVQSLVCFQWRLGLIVYPTAMIMARHILNATRRDWLELSETGLLLCLCKFMLRIKKKKELETSEY